MKKKEPRYFHLLSTNKPKLLSWRTANLLYWWVETFSFEWKVKSNMNSFCAQSCSAHYVRKDGALTSLQRKFFLEWSAIFVLWRKLIAREILEAFSREILRAWRFSRKSNLVVKLNHKTFLAKIIVWKNIYQINVYLYLKYKSNLLRKKAW